LSPHGGGVQFVVFFGAGTGTLIAAVAGFDSPLSRRRGAGARLSCYYLLNVSIYCAKFDAFRPSRLWTPAGWTRSTTSSTTWTGKIFHYFVKFQPALRSRIRIDNQRGSGGGGPEPPLVPYLVYLNVNRPPSPPPPGTARGGRGGGPKLSFCFLLIKK